MYHTSTCDNPLSYMTGFLECPMSNSVPEKEKGKGKDRGKAKGKGKVKGKREGKRKCSKGRGM